MKRIEVVHLIGMIESKEDRFTVIVAEELVKVRIRMKKKGKERVAE